ncbi:hypothetical protein [uncultured Pseudodesulfovibrio sp.]|uniref:hypothetical protein n=1 Tax=uncultured Pseudodesulfovibrio sp. TaxID=2035858 RepID=UPI0029C78AB1|nr:hypothetical protein [uncultured Pseudodesulfovibrio sp.]
MKNILNPEILHKNLILLSIFIATYEFSKDIIITRPKDLFITGFDDAEITISPDYKKHVLSRNKSPLYASLDWFKEQSAIDQNDIQIFEEIKNTRNEAVHEMMTIIKNGPSKKFEQALKNLTTLLYKIEKWWFVEIEFPIIADRYPTITDPKEAFPGTMLLVKIIQEIALGDENERNRIYEEFIKKTSTNKQTST